MLDLTDKTAVIIAGLVLLVAFLAALVLAFSGCTRLMDLDRHIWEPPTQTETEREEAKPPPTLEIIAGILALCGFGGMANWIRRVKVKQEKMKAKLNNHAAQPPAA